MAEQVGWGYFDVEIPISDEVTLILGRISGRSKEEAIKKASEMVAVTILSVAEASISGGKKSLVSMIQDASIRE